MKVSSNRSAGPAICTRYCVCPRPSVLDAEDRLKLSTPKAAILRGARWGQGDGSRPVITVSFLEGDTGLWRRVKDVALEWMDHANVLLDFRQGGNANVRVAFNEGDGSWSLLGTECASAAPGTPTVNFGWLEPDSPDDELRPVVLHEFGHVLGLIHEHQSPAGGGIKWNVEQVLREMAAPPNSWDHETTERNVVSEWDRASLSATTLDPASIMMYPIPSSWTLDGFSSGFNSELTDRDKLLVCSAYPP